MVMWAGRALWQDVTLATSWFGGCDHVPAYQLAVVVDDAAMAITEVVRGADLLKSTARQILLNRALGYSDPEWFHCDLVRDERGQRLAKRHDALSLRRLREQGVDPDRLRAAVEQQSDQAATMPAWFLRTTT